MSMNRGSMKSLNRLTAICLVMVTGAACAHMPPSVPVGTYPAELERAFEDGLAIAEEYRNRAITTRRFTHEELWTSLAGLLESPDFTVEEVGRSVQGRSIMTVTFGEGPTTVLLWSQMHGDESTATMALADIITWLATDTSDPARNRLRDELTIVMIPMLNPDGARLFQRRNAVGVDINRDARRLATPEARALKAVRDGVEPDFGFNLHDQNPHTLAGGGGPRAAIALLAPAADEERSWGAIRARARQVAATIAAVLQTEIPGRVARYGDAFNPRAFGDLMQQWGTSTVLIESGVLDDDPRKQKLRALNVAALLTALGAIADATYERVDPAFYEKLPPKRGFTHDLLIRGGTLVVSWTEPVRLDLAFAYGDGVTGTGLVLTEAGDLEGVYAHEVIDAAGLYLHPEVPMVSFSEDGGWLLLDSPAVLTIRKGPERDSEIVQRIDGRREY